MMMRLMIIMMVMRAFFGIVIAFPVKTVVETHFVSFSLHSVVESSRLRPVDALDRRWGRIITDASVRHPAAVVRVVVVVIVRNSFGGGIPSRSCRSIAE